MILKLVSDFFPSPIWRKRKITKEFNPKSASLTIEGQKNGLAHVVADKAQSYKIWQNQWIFQLPQ